MEEKKEQIFIFELQGRKVTFEINSLPLRAEKSVLCRYGNTTVLTTLCTSSLNKKPSFLHLTVFVNEKSYSIGKIPSIFARREGRSSYESIVITRLIDRSLRSCLSLDDKKEIQITNTILSLGESQEPRLAAFWNSFIVCFLSEELSFNKLLSIIVLAENNDSIIYNPSVEQLEKSSFEIVVVGSKDKIITLELSGKEISEEKLKKVIEISHLEIIKTIEKCFAKFFTEELLKKKNAVKKQFLVIENSIIMQLNKQIQTFLHEIINDKDLLWEKKKRLIEEFPSLLSEKFPEMMINEIEEIYSQFLQNFLGEWMNKNKQRIDGRRFDQLREISMGIDYLPAVHGSSFFSRGKTSVISVLTFKRGNEKQFFDDILIRENSKSFIHHYNFPPFAVNELSLAKGVSRREIGHGQLVEKTFLKLLPSSDQFPYTTRIVSEVVSSDGSSSQASICASSLAMMAAGFPLDKHVAGISLGLIAGNLLTDINDFEDKFGEIDFKIAGTEKGVCSLQLDVKNEGIDFQLLLKCLEAGKKSRITIIELMKNIISRPCEQLSPKVLKFQKIYLGRDKIKLVIGHRGKNIDLVTSKTGAHIDIKDDGFAFIYHLDKQKILETIEMIWRLVNQQ